MAMSATIKKHTEKQYQQLKQQLKASQDQNKALLVQLDTTKAALEAARVEQDRVIMARIQELEEQALAWKANYEKAASDYIAQMHRAAEMEVLKARDEAKKALEEALKAKEEAKKKPKDMDADLKARVEYVLTFLTITSEIDRYKFLFPQADQVPPPDRAKYIERQRRDALLKMHPDKFLRHGDPWLVQMASFAVTLVNNMHSRLS